MQELAQRLYSLRTNTRPIRPRVAVSQLCGLPSDAVRRYERGESIPTIESLIRLADYYEVSLDYLTGRENKK